MKKQFAHIITPMGMTLFIKGRPVSINKTSYFYGKVLDLFDDVLGEESLVEEIEKLFDRPDLKEAGFENGNFNGVPMHPCLVKKLESIKDSGAPVDGLVEFFKRLSENPSSSSVENLYDFLSFKQLPITTDGYFLAYKGVKEDYYSVMGNTKTILADGTKSDKGGHVYNGVGEKPFVAHRNQVDDERENTCSYGLHFGSKSFAEGFGSRTVVVKLDPKHVVAVPKDHQCQKGRAEGYEVICDFEGEIELPLVSVQGGDIQSATADPEYEKFTGRVLRYVGLHGGTGVKIQAIQNSFSPEYPSKQKVQSALQDLGYNFDDLKVID